MARKMLPGLEARSFRSGLITVSSIASYIPIPGLLNYCGTKSFVTFFTKAL
jgi:short-subunit dehydrogenase